MKKNILIVCDNNTLYSKLAEAYFLKYAGHWKNILSAGIHTANETVSPQLKAILTQDGLESTIDYSLKNIKDYELNSFDYVIALTEKSFDHLTKLMPQDRIVLVSIEKIKQYPTSSLADIDEVIKTELLTFVKKGPIKRWLEMN